MTGLQPGRDLILVLRSAAQAEANLFSAAGNRRVGLGFAEAAMRITADGQPLPRFGFQPGPGWSEHLARVPGSAIGGERLRLRLVGRYAAFQYWFFQ